MTARWLVLLAACKSHDTSPPPVVVQLAVHDAAEARPDARGKALELKLVTALPPGITARGATTLKQVSFTDTAGIHYVLFSATDLPHGRRLFVDAWLAGAGAPRNVEVVTDGIEACGNQLTVALHDAALNLTNLDHDGVAELTFAYEAGCRREPRGNPYTLLTLAGDKLYTMTGHTRLDDGSGPMGDFQPDAALAHGPLELREHARTLWDQTADDLNDPPKLDGGDDSAEPSN